MNVCPVCEAPVVARVCDVCGHAFDEAPVAVLEVPRLVDLEWAPENEAPSLVAPLSDLEPTRFAPATVPDDWSETEWERTSLGTTPDVVAGGFAELESGREVTAADPLPTALGPTPCRYCRNVQASGLLCERCGMALPRRTRAQTSAPPLLDDDTLVRCKRCGERTYQRYQCGSCGSRMESDE